MCRIFAIASSKRDVAPVLKVGLKRLEYGGYDSSGMATVGGGELMVRKGVGKLEEVDKNVHFDEMKGKIGIAHNRWATHGLPTVTNAHPQLDCKGEIAVVHNGVIENFFELKEKLIKKDHEIRSRTDTEIIAHLIEDYVNQGMDFVSAVMSAMHELQGSFALAIISKKEPDKVVVVKNESPLLLGVGNGENYAASDAVAFIDSTNKIIPLDDGEMAVITPDSYEIYRIGDGAKVEKHPVELKMSVDQVSKGGYEHYMLKEIMEQPTSIRYTLNLQKPYLDVLTELIDRARVTYLVGAGTSYNSCLAGSYMYSYMSALPTIPSVASEFEEQYGKALDADSALLLVSQSGETADVLRIASYARLKASTVLAITNVVGSTITRITRAYIIQQSGPEIGVAATKTYTSQLLVHMKLAMNLGKKRGKLSQMEMDQYEEAMEGLPKLVEGVLTSTSDEMKQLADMLYKSPHIFFMGRGINTATAYEGRLKMLEISYIPSTAYSAGESKHGPIALIEKGVPVIFIAPRDSTRKVMIGNVMEIKSRGGQIIAFGEEDDKELKELSDFYVGMPPMLPIVTPIAYVLPLQLLAYYTAVKRGLDPDKPRNLAKSVTVQRDGMF
ncbi:MAG: glutamine--fructose-6-phosphate transaminase (isomerizing) [Thermoprotei archaeon]